MASIEAAADGEISIPIGAATAEAAGDRFSKQETRLNWFVFLVAFGEWAGNAFGTLAFLWATVVLFGGFCTALNQEDFWFPTVLIFIESFRLFISNYRLDHQSLFGTTRAVKLVKRFIGILFVRPQEWNEVVAIIGLFFNLVMQFWLPFGGFLTLLVWVPIIFAGKVQFPVALQSMSRQRRHRRPLLWALLVAILALAGLQMVVLIEIYRDDDNSTSQARGITEVRTIITWPFDKAGNMPVDVLLLLAPVPPQVVAVLLLNLRPPRIANLTSSPCGRKLLSWAKLILALCLGGGMLFLYSALNLGIGSIIRALIVLVLSLGSLQAPVDSSVFGRWANIFLYICLMVQLESIAGVIIMIFTAILVVLLVGNYQIPAAVARVVLSSVRLYGLANNVDTYPQGPNSNWNLVPSVVAFYVLALCQGTLYLVACILELFSFFPRRSLVLHWFRGQWGVRAIDAYYQHSYAMCMEIGVLAAGRRMSLASFSVESLSSPSREMQLAGVSVLDALLQQRNFSEEVVLRITGSDKAMCTLVSTVGWTAQQDRDFRLFAARVTAELAGSLRLASIPGMLKLVSSLLDAQNQPTWHNYEQDLLSHAIGINEENVVDNQSPGHQSSAQSSHTNGGNATQEENNNGECSWLCWCWQWCYWSIPKEPALTCRDSFPVLGMLILERLAYDIDNCAEIGRSADLILKITGFMSSATGTSVSDDDDPQQKSLICSSLSLVGRLAITDGKVGMKLRQELWESPFLLNNLAGILEDNRSCPQLWKPAIDIIAIFALDEDAKNEIGSAKVMIGRLMHVFLGQDGATNMHYDRQLRAAAGEALANLSMESIANCLAVLGEPGYELVKDLRDMISNDEYSYVVTHLLHNLCAHSSDEMLHLGAGEHLSSALPMVMEKIMTAEGKELEALISLASQMRNVIPERFVHELELHTNGADLVRKLVYTLSSNRKPCPKYPRMRRAIVQITISLIQSCPRYTTIFAAGGMKEALSKIDRTPSRVEKYRAFLGNTGLVLESGLPLHILAARARGLIDSAAPTPSARHAS